MARERESIGLDVGSHAVKLVHLKRTGQDSVEILDYKIIESVQKNIHKEDIYPHTKNKDFGVGVYKETVSFIKRIKNNVPIIASIEGHQVFIRVFKLPGVGKSKLAKIVGYEAQQQVPFPIKDVVWAYQCLRKVSAEEADVVLVAAKKDSVEGFLNYFKQLGVCIGDVAAPVVGLFHLLNQQIALQDQATLILDLGAKTTNIVIIEKQNIWFRTVPLGGEIITRAISQEFNLGLAEAETFKKEKGCIVMETSPISDSITKKISSCIVRSITRLIGEIARSLDVYCSSFNSLGIRRIFLTGGTSRLRNIDKFLAKKFRVDVEGLDVVKGFNVLPQIKDDKISRDTPHLGVALGLALQGLGLGKFTLSLLPREVVKKQQWRKRRVHMAALAIMALFLGFSFSGYNMQISSIYKASIKGLENEKKVLNFNTKELTGIQNQLDAVKNELDIVNKIVNARTLWMDMILDLEELIPQNVWLIGIDPIIGEEQNTSSVRSRGPATAGKDVYGFLPEYIHAKEYIDLNLYGKTSGVYREIVAFRTALDKSKYFVSGATEVVSASPPKNGIRNFVIKVRLKTNEAK